VSSEELYRLAGIYGRSVADLLDGSPVTEVEQALFRADAVVDPAARIAVLEFAERCRAARALEDMIGLQRPQAAHRGAPHVARPPRSPREAAHEGERAAARERERLGLGSEPLRDPVALAEGQGIHVGTLDTEAPIDGVFFNTTRLGPCVGINPARDRWTGYRTSFTVAHEYGHWLFGDVRAEVGGEAPRFTTDPLEIRANAFAAAFLLPRDGVVRFFSRAGLLDETGRLTEINPAVVVRAMHHFGVSRMALLVRLGALGLVDRSVCDEPRLRDFPLRPVADALGLTLAVDHRPGARFADLVARAWAAEHITTGRAAGLLGLGIEEFRERMGTLGVVREPAADDDGLLVE
jgi:Zn-dependent peptidase ImmA (M78 family)